MFRLLKAPSVFLNSPMYPIPITFRNLIPSVPPLHGYPIKRRSRIGAGQKLIKKGIH
jgi:hypothetical protein